ncbi:MAG: hypothetical protein QOG34_1868, partial [Frankiaceae bacterium]|nr:hypothetical protein [Frankiaceae bacterium]
AAAIIHLKAALDHFDVSVVEAILFEVAACGQLLWGIAVYRGAGRRVLLAGVAGNVAIVVVWVFSRTTGLPIGPTPGHAEALGMIDTVASCDELLLAALVAIHLAQAPRMRALTATTLLLLLLSSLVVVGPHVH